MKCVALAIVLSGAFALVGRAQQPARDAPPQRPTTTGIINGRVVAADSGEAIRKARITVRPLGAGAPMAPVGASGPIPRPGLANAVPPAFTDSEGRFVVEGVPAGLHLLTVNKAGYVATTFGARRPGMPPIPIDVKDGGRVERLEIRIQRSAAISGRIVDEFGDPVEMLPVGAHRLLRVEGFSSIMRLAEAVTDDRGEYRLGGLPAGTFLVSATRALTPTMFNLMTSPDAATRLQGMPPQASATYYPGVSALAQAQSIDVRAGEERTTVDFAMTSGATSRLAMNFVDSKGDPTSASAIIGSVSNGPLRPLPRSVPPVGPNIVTTIEPGDWAIYARGDEGVGTARVTIGSANESVTVTLTRGARVSGRVATDGTNLPPGATVEVSAHPVDLGVMASPAIVPQSRANADGTFELTELVGPRQLRARVSGARGWIPKAITHNGRDLIDSAIELKPGEGLAGVEVLLTNRVAQVNGTVTNTEQKPLTDYSVLLFPEDRSLLKNPRRLARWVRPNAAGVFSVEDVLPGTYLIVAVDDVDDAGWLNADYLERFRRRATRVELGDAERKTIVLERVSEP